MDPSAGAGVLRDVLTLSALGIHPMAISTAETRQNGVACLQIAKPALSPVDCLEALRAHLRNVWGVKLGLCALELEAVQELMTLVAELGPAIRIWDPIQAPSIGVAFHEPATLRRMAEIVLPGGGWVVSPNRVEAAAITGLAADAEPSVLASAFLELGAKAVWLKGGHASGKDVEDFWVDVRGVKSLGSFPRLAGERRGTGCTLASAWLGYRLRGHDEVAAAELAGTWLRNRWDSAIRPGGVGRPCFAPGVG
jgi:hydroxymethylpyrimidine/phosphomethylpyrimidine kinase